MAKSKKIENLTLYLDDSDESEQIVKLLNEHPISYEFITTHKGITPRAEFKTKMSRVNLSGDVKEYKRFVNNVLDYWENL